MGANANLHKAKNEKNDEFYTRLEDIQNELKHYSSHFEGKVVYCNCDDCFESNFFKYFALQFNNLKLKKLICTCYAESGLQRKVELFGQRLPKVEQKKAYKIEITSCADMNNDGALDGSDIVLSLIENKENTLTELKGNGDFRSDECIELLKESDIVVTNPPFSLFREYVAQLMEYEKKFLIIGNMNAITYKEFFPLIKDNKVWGGYGFNLSMIYKTAYKNELDANRKYVIAHELNPDDGYVKVPAICWFTNLDHNKRHEKLILWKTYNENDYPKYDNYDAINVDKVNDIPIDYFGVMGVPITYLDKHNPDEFEIIGLGISKLGLDIGVRPYTEEHKKYRKEVQKRGQVDGDLYMVDKNNHPVVPYARVLIKRR